MLRDYSRWRGENFYSYRSFYIMRRNSRQRPRRDNTAPMQVVSVPTHVRPSYVIPVSFTFTLTTTSSTQSLSLPSTLTNRAFRVTSVQGTLASAAVLSASISLFGAQSNGTVQEVTTQTRNLTVAGSTLEIKVRNSNRVQHGVVSSSVTTPSILSITSSGGIGTFVGIAYVSVIGAFA